MWNKLRDWYLAVIGIVVIAGGLYIASHNASNDGSAKEQSKQSESVSSSTEAGKAPRAPDQSQTSPGAEAASTTKAPSAPRGFQRAAAAGRSRGFQDAATRRGK